MANAKKVERLLVSLESLLDTRYGTARVVNHEAAERLRESEAYYVREIDVYEGIDMDAYQEVYSRRFAEYGTQVLSNSYLTGMVVYLRDRVMELAREATVSPLFDGVEIEVNSYPFLLDVSVQSELVKCLEVWFAKFAPVTILYAEPKELTPAHVRARYALMVDYDYNAWLNLHSEAFLKDRLPDVLYFGPRLYFTGVVPDEQHLAEVMKDAPHPFEAIEMQASPIIGLKLIDIAHFSSLVRVPEHVVPHGDT